MRITTLQIHHLRSIHSAQLSLHPRCNFFYGNNGSGKTSLLESVYLLGSGHSFRTRETTPLIQSLESTLTVFGRADNDDSISIQKSLSGATKVQLNGQPCYSSSDLAHHLPCQVCYQDIFQIIDAGPSVRRMVLDWGLFHVEHMYHTVWKNYRWVLRQRNALLRQQARHAHIVPWDNQLVELGGTLHEMRSRYFERWQAQFQMVLAQLTDVSCGIFYYKGWDKKESGRTLHEVLNEQLSSDLQRQYTQSGAHQADIYFELSSKKAKQGLSRGQQKIVLIALKLAQAALVPKPCVYLLDDLMAELDADHQARLMTCLQTINGQLFFTAMDDKGLRGWNAEIECGEFVIEQGAFIKK